MHGSIYDEFSQSIGIKTDLLFKEECVKVDEMFGHGGLFKTKGVGQRVAAAAMNTSVSVMETAGEVGEGCRGSGS